jgi:hypothetical protein
MDYIRCAYIVNGYIVGVYTPVEIDAAIPKRVWWRPELLCVERRYLDRRSSVGEVHRYLPRIAAYLAILYVSLNTAPTGVYTDLDCFTAIRAGYRCRCVGCSVAKGEFIIEVVEVHTI